jgi:hypothetical protein
MKLKIVINYFLFNCLLNRLYRTEQQQQVIQNIENKELKSDLQSDKLKLLKYDLQSDKLKLPIAHEIYFFQNKKSYFSFFITLNWYLNSLIFVVLIIFKRIRHLSNYFTSYNSWIFLIICLIINVLIIYYYNKTYLSNKSKELNINYSFNKLLYSFFLFIPSIIICLINEYFIKISLKGISEDDFKKHCLFIILQFYIIIGFVVGVYSVILGIYYLSSVKKKINYLSSQLKDQQILDKLKNKESFDIKWNKQSKQYDIIFTNKN